MGDEIEESLNSVARRPMAVGDVGSGVGRVRAGIPGWLRDYFLDCRVCSIFEEDCGRLRTEGGQLFDELAWWQCHFQE